MVKNNTDGDPLGLGRLRGPCARCGRTGPVTPAPDGPGLGVALVCAGCRDQTQGSSGAAATRA